MRQYESRSNKRVSMSHYDVKREKTFTERPLKIVYYKDFFALNFFSWEINIEK